jgi:hypothetical protein
VALIDDALLLVLDRVDGAEATTTVQLHYHADSQSLQWDAARMRASTEDADVRLRLHATPALRGRVEAGAVAIAGDAMRPSRRLVLEDGGGLAGRRVYATVVVPYLADARPPELADLEINAQGEDVLVAWMLDGERRALRWDRDGLAPEGRALRRASCWS